MIRGNLSKGPQRSCLSACLLSRPWLSAPAVPGASATLAQLAASKRRPGTLISTRQYNSYGSPTWPSKEPRPPRTPRADGNPAPRQQQQQQQQQQYQPRQQGNNYGGNGQRNTQGGGQDREWSLLNLRPMAFSRPDQASRTQKPRDPFGQLANTLARSSPPTRGPASSNPSFGAAQPSRGRPDPGYGNSSRGGGGGGRGGRGGGGGGGGHQDPFDVMRGSPRRDAMQSDYGNRSRPGRGSDNRNADSRYQQQRRPAQPPAPDGGVDAADTLDNEFALPGLDAAAVFEPDTGFDDYERRRKPKKEKAKPEYTEKKKTKGGKRAKGGRRRNEDDDDMDEDLAERIERRREEKRLRREEAALNPQPIPIVLPQHISVANLGRSLRVKSDIFLPQLAELGFEGITLESIMTGETAALVAQEYGFEPSIDMGGDADLKPRPAPEDVSALPERPPIVTIMGHVDHGKTTMLDWLRKSSVVSQEHGGITQHIGAFSVKMSNDKQITFLDTPGHAAFLTMRQRGAHVTDIVVLVVAADDSVKPQTLEALKHARSANVPIIVAINKIDKDEARVDNVKADLARHGVEIEDFGGDVQVVCVSGRTGEGMEDLEEAVLTLSEILDMRAETDGMVEGWVLESSVKPVGRAASVLVKRGTLRKGSIITAGTTWAKVRLLRNEAGDEIEEAPPGTPVEILGWRDLPDAGDEVIQAPDQARAKEAVAYRRDVKDRQKAMTEHEAQEQRDKEKAVRDEAVAATLIVKEGKKTKREREAEAVAKAEAVRLAKEKEEAERSKGPVMVNYSVKGDVMGSVEAVCASIQEIGNNEVLPRILQSAPGAVTEWDIEHAAVTQSMIVNFNVPLSGQMKKLAEEAGVTILEYNVIYHLVDRIKEQLSVHLAPKITYKVLGEAEVLQVFSINLQGRNYRNVAGCRVRNGQLTNKNEYRVYRGNDKVFQGRLDTLKQGKKNVVEVHKGGECGMAFVDWEDIQAGDKIQAYEEIREKRTL